MALLEPLLTAVVLATAVSAVIMPFTAAAQSTAEDAGAARAVSLPRDLLAESPSPFSDPDAIEEGETEVIYSVEGAPVLRLD